jgi:hypothetical protein
VAFALLIPSLAVPIAAMALAVWRMGHLGDGQLPIRFGIGLYYFAAMIIVSATIFSMTITAVLAVRNHASLRDRTIPFGRLSPHFALALVVAAWTVQFSFDQLDVEGLAFGLVLIAGSVISLAVIMRGRVPQRRIEVMELGPWARRTLVAYPVLVAIVVALGIFGFVTQSDVQIIAVAVLGFLGLPWTGVSVLFWLPLGAIFNWASLDALPLAFLLLAAIPATANAVLAIVFSLSTERRTDFVNDFLEARTHVDRNTLAP